MPIKNYTTSVDPHRTVSEIQKLLGAKGARAVSIRYRGDGGVEAVSFALEIAGCDVNFQLPNRTAGVLAALRRQRVPRSLQNERHAERVGWRILKDWIDAQLALVEAGQAQLAEVFLPYAEDASGKTVFQVFESQVVARRLGTSMKEDG